MVQSQDVPNSELTQEVMDAKCRAANIIYDETEHIINFLNANNIDTWTAATIGVIIGAITISQAIRASLGGGSTVCGAGVVQL